MAICVKYYRSWCHSTFVQSHPTVAQPVGRMFDITTVAVLYLTSHYIGLYHKGIQIDYGHTIIIMYMFVTAPAIFLSTMLLTNPKQKGEIKMSSAENTARLAHKFINNAPDDHTDYLGPHHQWIYMNYHICAYGCEIVWNSFLPIIWYFPTLNQHIFKLP